MLKKGAVVIVKHGDENIANALEKGIIKRFDLSPENEDLKRDYTFLKKRDRIYWSNKISDAERYYGHNPSYPSWATPIISVFAFIIYLISVFIDKYLTIKER